MQIPKLGFVKGFLKENRATNSFIGIRRYFFYGYLLWEKIINDLLQYQAGKHTMPKG